MRGCRGGALSPPAFPAAGASPRPTNSIQLWTRIVGAGILDRPILCALRPPHPSFAPQMPPSPQGEGFPTSDRIRTGGYHPPIIRSRTQINIPTYKQLPHPNEKGSVHIGQTLFILFPTTNQPNNPISLPIGTNFPTTDPPAPARTWYKWCDRPSSSPPSIVVSALVSLVAPAIALLKHP